MTEISEEDFEMYKETFECFCDNHGTTVLVRKLEQLLHCVGYNPTPKEMRMFETLLHTKDTEKMDFDEFLDLMKKVEKMSGKPEEQESTLMKAFKQFDVDGSGFLERREIKKFLDCNGVDNPSDDDVEYILEVADKNHDGRIDVIEFSKLLSAFSQKTRGRQPNTETRPIQCLSSY